MENKPKKQRSYLNLFIRRLLSMKEDKAPEEETIASIKAGIDFRGANLWILIFAIFVASLGLNTNSAAVIIGAMLISPLMGPIVGMGLGVGIYDFELLKRAFRPGLPPAPRVRPLIYPPPLFSVCSRQRSILPSHP